ncbi:hypothetical protein EYZ11_004129 [Aspergillus tanneri]|uniref:Carrier domain-containing protein n=1 Tax=Aspergillus tanneri TaxID=1220188 RepID=A0A4S3JLS0_9EURO|nr:hypothetical protein EYZ11_004129 [Aspergillus tanneri]
MLLWRHAQNVATVLGAVIDYLVFSPLQPLAGLNLLKDYHHNLISRWNSHAAERSADRCIHTLFQLKCLETPGSLAVRAWDGCFTYAEVDVLSTKVAARLMEYGIGQECIVPLLMEKSKWVVVAILGVLKAGAAFVLLDISYPVGRLRDICQDTESKVLVRSINAPTVNLSKNVIVTDDHIFDWFYQPRRVLVTPQNAAYVSYTSGSTGRPKGVIIEHDSFCTNVIATSRAQNLSSSSRVLQYASFAFDVSIQECLAPLILGGCVCIPSESQRINKLAEACNELDVNWAELTPSVARLLQPEDIPSVTTLVLGGEPISPIDITRWRHVQLKAAYGPAECTIVSTVQPLLKDPSNIGYAFVGTSWIVDKDNELLLLPIGAVGELIIGGPIVGRGYLNRPAQTKAAFIQNPDWASSFGLDRNYRFYKTGDLVRYNVDGSIVYVGRKDRQVKLHGQRIELGEIEYHAQSCLEDYHITVDLAASNNQRPFLVLFADTGKQTAADASAGTLFCEPSHRFWQRMQHVKARLLDTLPNYMVPALYIPVREIPLSRTGKVDRRMLQSAVGQLTETELRKYRPSDPHHATNSPTPAEESFRQIFATVLGLPTVDIGVDGSFFQFGGDSISAISVVAEARKKGLEITVASVFKYQCIRSLVANLENIQAYSNSVVQPFSLLDMDKKFLSKRAAEQCNIFPGQIEDIYLCTPLQEAMICQTVSDPGSFQARFRFRLPSTIDVARFKDAWRKVIAAHPILRTRIVQLDAPRALQVVVSGEERVHWHSLENVHGSMQPCMSLGTPLIQLGLTTKARREPLSFLLKMHHAIFDAYSHKIILDDVQAAYRGLSVTQQSFLPFIQYISTLDMDDVREFWKREFQGVHAPDFPALTPAPKFGHNTGSVTRIHHRIPMPNWPRGRYTPSTVLRLAYTLLIAWATRCNDIVFGVTINGRSAPIPGIHRFATPTIATVPLRTVLQPDDSAEETMIRMQEHATRLIPFEQTGLRWIKNCSAEAASACKFQSLLVIHSSLSSEGPPEIFGKALDSSAEQLNFNMHPLTLICELDENQWIKVTAVIDSAVISQEEAKAMLQRFEYLLHLVRENQGLPICLDGLEESELQKIPSESQPDREMLCLAASRLCRTSLQHFMYPVASESSLPAPFQVEKARNVVACALGLKKDSIGCDDDFFSLGGDSISAMQIVVWCKQDGFALTVPDIFRERKVGLIARKLTPHTTVVPPQKPATDPNTSGRFRLLRFSSYDEIARFESEIKAKLGISSMDTVEDAYPCTSIHEGLLETQSKDMFALFAYAMPGWPLLVVTLHFEQY